jgi:glycosyltransferase involved in cell wall biosynthesis
MVEAFDQVGGPPKLVRLIMGSPLRQKYEFHVLSYCISGFNLKAALDLRSQLVQLKPDIVHIHGLKSDGFLAAVAAALARRPRILVTIHASSAQAILDYQSPVLKLRQWIVSQMLEPATLRLADAAYCVCEAMKSDRRIRKSAQTKLRDTIHNGVEIKPTAERNLRLRQEFGFSDDAVVVIYTGRMSRDKGLEVLAAAMNKIMQRGVGVSAELRDKIKLLLVGDGREMPAIRRCFQPLIQSNQVVMAGKRDDIDGLNATADIFVFPSLHENLSFSLLEAMNAALPVIATAVGGNVEVVVQDQTGFLVPPGDADALAQSIVQLSADANLRERMGLAGRERLGNQFSVASMVRKTDEVYQSLLGPRRLKNGRSS